MRIDELDRWDEIQGEAERGSHMIYRACPVNVVTFSEMDYVTKSLKFAKEHAESMYWTEEEPYHVISAMVSNRPNSVHLFHASNPGEYFYGGPDLKGKVVYKANEYEEFHQ